MTLWLLSIFLNFYIVFSFSTLPLVASAPHFFLRYSCLILDIVFPLILRFLLIQDIISLIKNIIRIEFEALKTCTSLWWNIIISLFSIEASSLEFSEGGCSITISIAGNDAMGQVLFCDYVKKKKIFLM